MRACEYDATSVVKLLVESGADVNAKMESGWTALYTVIKKANEELFNYLQDSGADTKSI